MYEVHYQRRTDRPQWERCCFSTESLSRAENVFNTYKQKEKTLPKFYRMVCLYKRLK